MIDIEIADALSRSPGYLVALGGCKKKACSDAVLTLVRALQDNLNATIGVSLRSKFEPGKITMEWSCERSSVIALTNCHVEFAYTALEKLAERFPESLQLCYVNPTITLPSAEGGEGDAD